MRRYCVRVEGARDGNRGHRMADAVEGGEWDVTSTFWVDFGLAH